MVEGAVGGGRRGDAEIWVLELWPLSASPLPPLQHNPRPGTTCSFQGTVRGTSVPCTYLYFGTYPILKE